MKETKIPFVQAELRIIYGIDEAGEQIISTTYTADGVDDSVPDYFTGLTMLEVAKHNFLQRHGLMMIRQVDQDRDD